MMSDCPFVHLSVHLSVHLPICLSVCLQSVLPPLGDTSANKYVYARMEEPVTMPVGCAPVHLGGRGPHAMTVSARSVFMCVCVPICLYVRVYVCLCVHTYVVCMALMVVCLSLPVDCTPHRLS